MDGVRTLSQAPDDQAIAVAIVDVLIKVRAAVDAIGQLQVQIQGAGGGGIPGIGDLPRRLTDFLASSTTCSSAASASSTSALHLLGLIEDLPAPPPGQPSRAIHWNRLAQVVERAASRSRRTSTAGTRTSTPTQFLTRLDATDARRCVARRHLSAVRHRARRSSATRPIGLPGAALPHSAAAA